MGEAWDDGGDILVEATSNHCTYVAKKGIIILENAHKFTGCCPGHLALSTSSLSQGLD